MEEESQTFQPIMERVIHPVMDRVSYYCKNNVECFAKLKVEALELSQGSPERQFTDKKSTIAIEELERAFELLETSNPGFGDVFIKCLVTQLQRG